MNILLHTKEQTFLAELREDTPEGMTIIDGGERRVRFDDINANIDISFNIEITIDMGKIAIAIALAWIAKKAASRPRDSYINIAVNGKESPINNPDTIKMIENKINDKQEEQ
jgi:hypothetical protein